MRRAAGFTPGGDDRKNQGPPLPNLPGHSLSLQQTMGSRPRAQTLKYRNGYPIVEDMVGELLGDTKDVNKAHSRGAKLPDWLAYDREVLRFYCWFREDVPNSPDEKWRVRKCVFMYYLDTDLLEVWEDHVPNSGMQQGVLLHRHRAVLEGGKPLHWRDLRVGQQLVMYSRTYTVASCDAFTRAFCKQQGMEQPPDLVEPDGPFEIKQRELLEEGKDVRIKDFDWGSKLPNPPPFALHNAVTLAPSAAGRREQAPQSQQQQQQRRQAKLPDWLAYDREVLRFYCWFREDVPNSPDEKWRVRKCVFMYYLDSNLLEVWEDHVPNSGMPQGVLLHKHRAVLEGGKPLHWRDLRVGQPLVMYSRTYTVASCDAFTRAFCKQQGAEQPVDAAEPEGPLETKKRELDSSRRAAAAAAVSASGHPDDADAPFGSPRGANAVFELFPARRDTEHLDGIVLRFYCAWDNTAAVFGEVLPFALHYFVADGTVEVSEVHRRNSGRDPFPLLLSRMRLPKTTPPVYGRPMSPRSRRALHLQYYEWQDLRLGMKVNVFGRPLYVYDCDDATRAWYRKHLGLAEEQLQPRKVEFDLGPKRPPMDIPPNSSGFGSEEDSLQNVLHLVPKAPRKPYTDFLENWNKVLRFSARMAPVGPGRQLIGPHDAERSFIVSFHVLDKTLSIWEPRRDNSGMECGTYLERTAVPNPATGEPFAETDLKLGSTLAVYGRGFLLLDADAFTMAYMEKECAAFPWADYHRVLGKLQSALQQRWGSLPGQLREALLAADTTGSGYLDKNTLQRVLSGLGLDLSLHEVVTLVRALGADRQGLLQDQLLGALGLAPSSSGQQHQQGGGAAADEAARAEGGPDQDQGEQAGTSGPDGGGGDALRQQPGGRPRVAWQSPLAVTAAAGASALPVGAAPSSSSSSAGRTGPPTAPPSFYRGIGPTPGHPRGTGAGTAPSSSPLLHRPAQLLTASAAAQAASRGLPPKSPAQAWASGGADRRESDTTRERDTPEKKSRPGALKDPRFEDPPGGIGWDVWSAGAGEEAVAAGGAASSSAAAAAAVKPLRAQNLSLLWQTTNTALGGIDNPSSFRRSK